MDTLASLTSDTNQAVTAHRKITAINTLLSPDPYLFLRDLNLN